MPDAVYITTALSAKPQHEALARRFAQRLGGLYVPRRERSIAEMMQSLGTEQLLVCGERIVLHSGGKELFFHPSMAAVRLKRLLGGGEDILLQQSGVAPGDTVIDGTLGLGADAIIFAYAVGERGCVIGVEAHPVLAEMIRFGLQQEIEGWPELTAAMRRIRVVTADHLDFLRQQPDRSADIVYFDPMFRETVQDAAAMAPLRHVAWTNPLQPEAVRQALRVARKAVILKERRNSGEFRRLGFPPPQRRSAAVAYAVIRCEGGAP